MRAAARPTSPGILGSGSWVVEASGSTVGFRVRHLGVATVVGHFTRFDGRTDDGGVTGTVDVASIDSGQPVRDARLRSPECFDADRFPHMRLSAPRPVGSKLYADLTIRDVTRPVCFELAAEALGPDAVRLSGSARISRDAFGLDWAALVKAGRRLVSDRVDLVIDLVLRR
jgi:polyisoprenoid-binding protein YceI